MPISPRLLAIGGLIAMASAIGIGRFIYTPILPPMAEGLQLTKGEAGLIAAANFVGYLVGALAAASARRSAQSARLVAGGARRERGHHRRAWPGRTPCPRSGWRFIGGIASAYVLVLASALVLERLDATGHGACPQFISRA